MRGLVGRDTYPVNMPLVASTGPVLATNGMFTGMVSSFNEITGKAETFNGRADSRKSLTLENSPTTLCML